MNEGMTWEKVRAIYLALPDSPKKSAIADAYREYRGYASNVRGSGNDPALSMRMALEDHGVLRKTLVTDDGAEEYDLAMAGLEIVERLGNEGG